MSLEGFLPLVFYERQDFLLNSLDAIVNHADKINELSHGQYDAPLIIRSIVGSSKPIDPGITHTQDLTKSIKLMVNFPIYEPKTSKEDFDFSGLLALRQLLSNEKARIFYTLKTKHPQSIYQLAKFLKRDFKSVREDITILERFGFISLIEEKLKGRTRHLPKIIVDEITIHLKI